MITTVMPTTVLGTPRDGTGAEIAIELTRLTDEARRTAFRTGAEQESP